MITVVVEIPTYKITAENNAAINLLSSDNFPCN